MDVCYFTPIFPPRYSGATFQSITLAKALRKKGCNILFVAFTEGEETRGVIDGLEVYYIPVKDLNRIIGGKASTVEYLNILLRLFILLFRLRNKFSIIHSHILGHPYTALSVIGSLLRKKTVAKVTMSSDIDFASIGRFYGRLNRSMTAKFDRLIAISTEIRQDLRDIDMDQQKIEFIPNSIDVDRFHPVSAERKKALKMKYGIFMKYIITFVGGITFRKGVNFLVEIWPDIIKMFPDSLLVLVGPKGTEDGILGDESCYKEVMEIIERFKLERNVILTGRVSNVEEYLQISDLVAFPSKKEGMPNVVLESMACGIPVVSYNVSGINDIIQRGINGEIIDARDKKSFVSTLIDLLQEPSKREMFSRNAYRDVSDGFSVDKIAERYIQLYRNL